MAFFLSLPPLLRLFLSLALILLIAHLTRRIVLAIILGTCALAALCGHTPATFLAVVTPLLFSTHMASLMLVVFAVIWLSDQMVNSGIMQELVAAVRTRLSPRITLAALPALIGLLPMPGGAAFSAPMVAQCDDTDVLDPTLKTTINLWFRHIWEYCWPLYPGLILAVELSGVPLPLFVIALAPMTGVSIAAGFLFLLRRVPRHTQAAVAQTPQEHLPLMPLTAPLWCIIGTYALVALCTRLMPEAYAAHIHNNPYLPLIAGAAIAVIYLQRSRPLSGEKWRKILLSKRTCALVLVVVAVRLYGAFIVADSPHIGTSLVAQLRDDMQVWGIPFVAVIMCLPFLCGFTTGLTVGYVGASIPVAIALLGPDPPLSHLVATTLLAYTCGYIGFIISPVHVCLIVTTAYFRTRLMHNIIHLFLPGLFVMCVAVLLYYLYLYLPILL